MFGFLVCKWCRWQQESHQQREPTATAGTPVTAGMLAKGWKPARAGKQRWAKWRLSTFDLYPWGEGGAWGAGTNMWHPETPDSCESLPAPLATQIPTLWIHTSGGGAGVVALILDRGRAFDLFASVDAHLCWEASNSKDIVTEETSETRGEIINSRDASNSRNTSKSRNTSNSRGGQQHYRDAFKEFKQQQEGQRQGVDNIRDNKNIKATQCNSSEASNKVKGINSRVASNSWFLGRYSGRSQEKNLFRICLKRQKCVDLSIFL